jgi:hypothetical protein
MPGIGPLAPPELLLLAPDTEFRLGAVCVLLEDGRSACFAECAAVRLMRLKDRLFRRGRLRTWAAR